MSLSVLTDEQIKSLLESLQPDELEAFQQDLRSQLHDYSNGSQSSHRASNIQQPRRTAIDSTQTGATTLFMPSSSDNGIAVKVVTLSPPSSAQPDPSSSSPTTTTTNDDSSAIIKPTGAITIFTKTGQPYAILHASTLTAFRTALASSILVSKRDRVQTLTVFGAGEQAYWHVRLALLARGATVRAVNVVNRRFGASCRALLRRLHAVPAAAKAREGWAACSFGVLTPGYGDFDRLLREQLRAADVVFCCTPSTEPLFDHAILTAAEGRKKGRLIVAVGSYKPDMLEVPLEVIHQAVKTHDKPSWHFHRHAIEGGVVVVDTLDGAMKEAGEIVQAGLGPHQLIELGELVMLQRITMDEGEFSSSEAISSSSHRPSSPGTPTTTTSELEINGGGHRRKSSQGRKPDEDLMCQWLQAGNVVYKSVGMGLIDLAVGLGVVKLAGLRGVGTRVEGF